MPRLRDSRSWEILRNVPATYFRLVKEVLSLRQKIVLARQTIHFLRRCLQNQVVPNFIRRKRLHELCGLPKENQQVLDIELRLLRAALRHKQDEMYAQLKKCEAKEDHCGRYLENHLWRSIVGGSILICNSI